VPDETNRVPILGFLARTWVIRHREVAATTSVAHLLRQSEPLEAALRALISQRAGLDLPIPLRWTAEHVLPSGVRPDLEGCLDDQPVVRIEAKFGAALTAAQLYAYRWDASAGGQVPRAVALVLPAARASEGRRVVDAAVRLPAPVGLSVSLGGWIGCLSWDELFDGLQVAVATAEDASDLTQLRALVAGAEALDVDPFVADETWADIGLRLPDLISVVDQASRPQPGITAGRGEPDSQFHWRRYAQLAPTRTNVALGILRDWEHRSPVTPIWIRFHRDTEDFPGVLSRARSIPGRFCMIDKGNLIMPLQLPRDVTGSVAAADVARQLADLCGALSLPVSNLPAGPGASFDH
jgi:hypothetical protein